MVTTRSKTADTQSHLEEFRKDSKSAPQETTTASEVSKLRQTKSKGKRLARKRKSPPPATKAAESGEPSNKKSKSTTSGRKPLGSNDDSIVTINRSPVLHLWSACVTHFLHPELSWETCLSAGSAVASICAVAKGRSIGTLDKADETDAKQAERQKRHETERSLDEIEIMHFKLRIKDGKALFSGKPASSSENAVRGKFGDSYDNVKAVFDEALGAWKGVEEELNRRAFKMYEDFRPGVAKGQGGWGRKGVLRTSVVKNAVGKENV